MSSTVLYTVNKEKTLGVSNYFENAWLFGLFIYEVLWPKYGKGFSYFASSKEWDEIEERILSSNDFENKIVYLSMAFGFFHLKDKIKVGQAIISFANKNKSINDKVKKRMIEVGKAMQSIEEDNVELFGLCINTVYNYVIEAFNTGYDTFIKHAKEEFPDEEESFYEKYYEKMKEEFKDRKMYDDDTNYNPLVVVDIDENDKINIENLSDYYNRQKKQHNK